LKILVAGANGNTGFRLTRLLAKGGHDVRAMIRDSAQAGRIEATGAQPYITDLEGDISSSAEGCEAVFFAAGGGRGSGPEKKETVDHMGAVKLMEAAVAANATRFILLSSIRIDYPDTWPDHLRAYLAAKKKADQRLLDSDLNYTIVRPGRLTDAPGAGHVAAGNLGGQQGEVTRDDVAAVMAACLDFDNTRRKIIDLLAGDVPIPEALQGI